MNNGPTIQVLGSCLNCIHCRSERYRCQGDSGHDVSCAHPNAPGDKYIGDTRWTTPSWCPFLAPRTGEQK